MRGAKRGGASREGAGQACLSPLRLVTSPLALDQFPHLENGSKVLGGGQRWVPGLSCLPFCP